MDEAGQSMLKEIAQAMARHLPFLRRRYHYRKFLRDWGTGFAYWGVYDSFEAARREIPAGALGGHDRTSLVSKYEDEMFPPRVIDYPVVFWLSRILRPGTVLFDLGGSIGVTFYVGQRILRYPEGLCWRVCDLPEVSKAGEARARPAGAAPLVFTTDRKQAEGCDVYITGGTLQYFEEPFAQILLELKKLPPHVLVNKVPLCEGDSFVTLQNIGGAVCPYKISNRAQFIRSLEDLGYTLVDFWEINRTCEIPLRPDRKVRNFHGMYFQRAG